VSTPFPPRKISGVPHQIPVRHQRGSAKPTPPRTSRFIWGINSRCAGKTLLRESPLERPSATISAVRHRSRRPRELSGVFCKLASALLHAKESAPQLHLSISPCHPHFVLHAPPNG